jgi:hypothetical protein
MEKNQIYLWYVDDALIDIFAIKDLGHWKGEYVAYLYGMEGWDDNPEGRYRMQFFDEMELLENITDMAVPEEQEKVIALCRQFNIPVPGSTVRIDRFKPHGKWVETLELDMSPFWDTVFTHDAVKQAISLQYPNIKIGDVINRTKDSYFIICLKPFHKNSFPVTIWEV